MPDGSHADGVSESIMRPLVVRPNRQDLYSAELRAVESRVQAAPREETGWAAYLVIAGQPAVSRPCSAAGQLVPDPPKSG
jgi:hypothetical protein